MAAEPNRLLALAEAVADGRPIDWASASGGLHDEDRVLLAQLRLLAGVGEVHRTGGAAIPSDSSEDTAPGPRFWGGLEIRGLIGAGQFGTVYRAFDPRLEREVALKLLHRPNDGTANGVASTAVNEGRLLARISRNPHVITVFGADCIDDRVGLWMELVRGSTLEAVCHSRGVFSPREAALVGVDLCSAVADVHRLGLVHRDIKAQNVMREEGGRIVLMDFGAGEDLAVRVRSGRITGTPLYMAPELFETGRATPQSDLYSIGVLLFWLVTRSYPVPGRTAGDVQAAIARGERRLLRDQRPDLPAAFVTIVERALARDPAERYSTAGALEEALRHFVSERPSGESRWRQPRYLLLAAAIVIALLAATAWTFRTSFSPAQTGGAQLSGIRSVVVQPFANVSGDSGNDYFATALADLLVSRLGSIKALRVMTPGDGAALPPSVGGVITGSVDRRGTQVRVNARLLQAGGSTVLWSESYDGSIDEMFAMQGRIARDIAHQIRITLSDEERARLNQSYRPDSKAQDNYLRARLLMHRQERDALLEARRLLEEATELDPGYQLGFAALARCHISLQSVGVHAPADAAALARKAASAALAIDDNADARLAMAHVSFLFDWDWAAADSAFRRTLDLNPSLSEARDRFSRFLSAAGRTQEAVEQARYGLQLDPLSLEMRDALALALFYDRKYPDARATLESVPLIDDQSPTMLGRIYAALGDHATASRYIATAYARTKNTALLAERGRLEAVAGRRERAQAILADLREIRAANSEYLFPGDLAFLLIALGSTDEALDWLETAVQERGARALWLRVDPRVDAVRSHPRFQQLLRRIGP
jgi:serine/threonine protein kinase/Tfp pilus assembly protein PilF